MRLARLSLLVVTLAALAGAAPEPAGDAPGLVGKDHWAFKPPVRPDVPVVADASRAANPIDAFVLTRLQSENLTSSPEADRRTLIRRAYFDVTGLPPTPEEVEAFVADPDPAAYEKLVDRLLASPRYGERWARHWLDVVRFAESHGFEMNNERPGSWHYRDWVIRALNDDMPYDRFVREQIAGDALGADAATGFLVGGPWDQVKSPDPVLTANQRADELHDMVATTGSAFLGLTVGCARCHDHKFDPISQVDYFRFVADFAGVQHGERPLRTPESGAQAERLALLGDKLRQVDARVAAYEPLAQPGRTFILVDEPQVTQLMPAAGREPHYDGIGRGERRDPGDGVRLPNVGRGYFYWTNVADTDVFTWNPSKAGRFRVWLSWGNGWSTHAPDAAYFLDADGDLETTADRTPLATADHRGFADGTSEGTVAPGRALWSGFRDAGVRELNEKSRIVLRGGAAAETFVSADVMLLEAVPGAGDVVATPIADAAPSVRPGLRVTRNVDRFLPTRAKFVRFTILDTSNAEPCIDELEIYAAGDPAHNIALASNGAKAAASGTLAGFDIHKLEHVNDGRYGNSWSWISDQPGKGWVQIELPEVVAVERVEWGRDRELMYKDRLATRYQIEVAAEPGAWRVVADRLDRLPYALDGSAQEILRVAPGAPAGDPAALAALLAERSSLRQQLGAGSSADPKGYAGQFQQPGKTFRLARGDPMQPKDEVAPGTLSAVGKPLELPPDAPEQQRRVALAEWIADPANPLTARVIVNRIWHYHFGQGLVNTPSDLGNMGAKPTHPELLDWLATELVAQGWRLKPIHRLILLSSTYRQSSAARPDAVERDAGTSLLWRYPPRRLEAEAIRDAALAVSGQLDLSMGGPGFSVFKPNENYVRVYEPKETWGPAEYRRMVYAWKIRSQADATFGAFDCPDGAQITPKRPSSTTPLQALNLLNGSFMLQQAERFAERLNADAGADVTAQVDRSFALAFGRPPRDVERDGAVRLIAEHGLPAFCRALLNANEFVYVR